jgi:hypothetical protein
VLRGANFVQMLACLFFFLVGSNFPEIDATKAPFAYMPKYLCVGARPTISVRGMPYQVDPIPLFLPLSLLKLGYGKQKQFFYIVTPS